MQKMSIDCHVILFTVTITNEATGKWTGTVGTCWNDIHRAVKKQCLKLSLMWNKCLQ